MPALADLANRLSTHFQQSPTKRLEIYDIGQHLLQFSVGEQAAPLIVDGKNSREKHRALVEVLDRGNETIMLASQVPMLPAKLNHLLRLGITCHLLNHSVEDSGDFESFRQLNLPLTVLYLVDRGGMPFETSISHHFRELRLSCGCLTPKRPQVGGEGFLG